MRISLRRPAAAASCSQSAILLEPLEPRTLLSHTPLLAPLPQSILAHTGRSDATVIGDLDGDGWNEVLVGLAGVYSAGRSAGFAFGAYVLSGRDGSVLREHEVGGSAGSDPSGGFGQTVAAIGDVTGDGVIDYAIGRPNQGQGFVHVYSGASGEELASLTHDPFSIFGLGRSLLALGDVTGDDVPDFAAGAPTWSYRPPGTTLVYIYSGADFSVHATAESYPFGIGEFLALAGDVDGDGANDFLTGQNRVYSGATGELLLQLDFAGAGVTQSIGAVTAVSDLDGDGQADFAAGVGQQQRIVFFSSADGSFLRDITVAGFPGGLESIGDRTGDGFDEIAVRVDGRIEVYSTADGALLQTIDPGPLHFTTPGGAAGDGTYATALATGDVNADGRTDLIVLSHMLGGYAIATGTGRTDVFLGQNIGVDLFDRDVLDKNSDLRITSDDGLAVAGVNPHGDLIVFTRVTQNDPWRFDTLIEGGSVYAVDVFRNPRDGRLTIAASTSDHLVLFSLASAGQWVSRVIEGSGDHIMRSMEAFYFADGRVGLVGVGVSNVTGLRDSLLLYEQSGNNWTFTNITLNLSTHAQIQPDFEEFTVYVAPWNAVHITGRGPAGISTVWKSHLTPHWVTTMIGQEVPEAQALTNLSAFVAPWGGLHVAGVTDEGHVGVLWWSFELLETGWEYTDLTTAVNGPLFQQVPIATYVTDWGGLNIAGVNTDGDLAAYWWVPGATWVGEVVAIDPGSMPLANPAAVLDAVFEPRHQGMRITARSETNEILLYTWRPAQGHTWLFENLSLTIT